MAKKYLHIELGDDGYVLDFEIAEHTVAQLWLDRMALRHDYELDHPNRFYGFDSFAVEQRRAFDLLNNCVQTINEHEIIVNRPFEFSQDYLNYLHHIFEQYHGLLNQQNHEFWRNASQPIRTALADLNLAIHRCEALYRSPEPRVVCTWFGLPKTKTLSSHDLQQHGVVDPPWGSVCLNYCEIGKTLEDLARDSDNYISDEAFKPFEHFSADFVVYFYQETSDQIAAKLRKMQEFFDNHVDFFSQRGYNTTLDPKLRPLRIPVAQLVQHASRDTVFNEIKQRQFVKKVTIDETSNYSSSR